MKNKRSKVSPVWFGIIFAVGVVIMLVWTSIRALQETPTREVTLELPGQGWVTFSLTTVPYPPLPTGTVSLELIAMNRNGVTLNLSQEIPYAYGAKGSQTPLGEGDALRAGPLYRAGVQFPAPGDYWLTFDLGDGKQIKFQIYVKPAQ